MQSVFSFSFIEAFNSKQRTRQNEDYVISRKITTILKIAVNSVTPSLAPFSWKQPIKFNRDFENNGSDSYS